MRLHIVSILINLHQNRYINECNGKKKAKSRNCVTMKFFLWDIEELTFVNSQQTHTHSNIYFVPKTRFQRYVVFKISNIKTQKM